jgi:hypothetical protein
MADTEVETRVVELSEVRAGFTLRPGHRTVLVVNGVTGTPRRRPSADDASDAGHFVHIFVKDAQGNPKPGAEVRIHHEGNVVATGVADASGEVRIAGLPRAESFEVEVVGHHADHGGAS